MSFYVTTPIYYVNDLPHVGHIYTTMVTDTIARYRRLCGDETYFITGTDEHGQNIEKAAAERGVRPIELADEVVERYHQHWSRLAITHDDFIRTTEERHETGVHEIIRRIADNGDFYVGRHEGFYCSSCETFYTEKELLAGDRCPVHEKPCEKGAEENVFFRLSKYQDRLLELYETHPEFVRPESRLNEVKQFVSQGLRDLSVSRTTVDWGIPFPEHDEHTVYVWLDALTNYISVLGFGGDETELYDRFWADDDATAVHVIGKDILRHHAIFWPAFLMAADLPLPNTVWAHGWWLRDGKKVSKSAGGVVRPDYLVDRFGGDPLRFYLLRDMVFGQDASFSDESFIERYNSDLANDVGNTTSRLVTLCRRAFDGHLPPEKGDGAELEATAKEKVADYHEHMEAFAFQDAIRALFELLGETSQYLVRKEPWKKLKDAASDDEARREVSHVLWNCLEALRIVTSGLLPFLPQRAPQVLAAIGAPVPTTFGGTSGDHALAWGRQPTGGELPEVEPLFPRIDKDAWIAEAEAEAAKAAGEAKKDQEMSDETRDETNDDQNEDQNDDRNDETKDKAPAADAPKADTKVQPPADERIDIEQFFDTVLTVGNVEAAEKVPKSSKLMQLTVDVGEAEPRTVIAGIAKAYDAEDIVGRQVVVVTNLKPAKLMGIESNGMVLAASEDGKPVLLHPEREVPAGTRVR